METRQAKSNNLLCFLSSNVTLQLIINFSGNPGNLNLSTELKWAVYLNNLFVLCPMTKSPRHFVYLIDILPVPVH